MDAGPAAADPGAAEPAVENPKSAADETAKPAEAAAPETPTSPATDDAYHLPRSRSPAPASVMSLLPRPVQTSGFCENDVGRRPPRGLPPRVALVRHLPRHHRPLHTRAFGAKHLPAAARCAAAVRPPR